MESDIVYTKHAERRMAERCIMHPTVMAVLIHGTQHENTHTENKTTSYIYNGLCVVAVPWERSLRVITVFELGEFYEGGAGICNGTKKSIRKYIW